MRFEDDIFETGADHILIGTDFTMTLPFCHRHRRGITASQICTSMSSGDMIRRCALSELYVITGFTRNGGEEPDSSSWIGPGLMLEYSNGSCSGCTRLAGRISLPAENGPEKWETERIMERGDGPAFTLINPEFEAYFEKLRLLAGEPGEGVPVRPLPVFDQKWVGNLEAAMSGGRRCSVRPIQ